MYRTEDAVESSDNTHQTKTKHMLLRRFQSIVGSIRHALKRPHDAQMKVAAVQFVGKRKSFSAHYHNRPTCVTSAGIKTFNPEIHLEHVGQNEEVRVYIGPSHLDIQQVRKCKSNSRIRQCSHQTLIDIPNSVELNSLVFIEQSAKLKIESKSRSESHHRVQRKPSCLLMEDSMHKLQASWYIDASGNKPKIKSWNSR